MWFGSTATTRTTTFWLGMNVLWTLSIGALVDASSIENQHDHYHQQHQQQQQQRELDLEDHLDIDPVESDFSPQWAPSPGWSPPTQSPTQRPSWSPTLSPTKNPTKSPTQSPTQSGLVANSFDFTVPTDLVVDGATLDTDTWQELNDAYRMLSQAVIDGLLENSDSSNDNRRHLQPHGRQRNLYSPCGINEHEQQHPHQHRCLPVTGMDDASAQFHEITFEPLCRAANEANIRCIITAQGSFQIHFQDEDNVDTFLASVAQQVDDAAILGFAQYLTSNTRLQFVGLTSAALQNSPSSPSLSPTADSNTNEDEEIVSIIKSQDDNDVGGSHDDPEEDNRETMRIVLGLVIGAASTIMVIVPLAVVFRRWYHRELSRGGFPSSYVNSNFHRNNSSSNFNKDRSVVATATVQDEYYDDDNEHEEEIIFDGDTTFRHVRSSISTETLMSGGWNDSIVGLSNVVFLGDVDSADHNRSEKDESFDVGVETSFYPVIDDGSKEDTMRAASSVQILADVEEPTTTTPNDSNNNNSNHQHIVNV